MAMLNAKELRESLFGKGPENIKSWLESAFQFHKVDHASFFAILQYDAGPCGVFACVQVRDPII